MTKEEKYDQALSEYLEHGINYNATPIKNTPADDLKALASDSFHYGYLHGCNRIADLTAENTRLREARKAEIIDAFNAGYSNGLIVFDEDATEQDIDTLIHKGEDYFKALKPDNSK